MGYTTLMKSGEHLRLLRALSVLGVLPDKVIQVSYNPDQSLHGIPFSQMRKLRLRDVYRPTTVL